MKISAKLSCEILQLIQPHLLCTCVLSYMSIFFIVHFVVRSKHGDASIAIYTKMVAIGCELVITTLHPTSFFLSIQSLCLLAPML